ncbi:MAG: sugar ABC transporter permease, partial [Pseudomonadota bacterium]|nr:sugar ABC transporter permease [Pseudomonadota bacterium]
MTNPPNTLAAPPRGTGFWKDNLREYGMMMSLLAIVLFFQFATGGVILKPLNITNIILQNSYIVIMALGMLMVIVTGHIDLSVGSVAGFIGAIAAVLMVQYDLNFVLAAVICLALGGLIGAAQGFWIAYFKIPSFIVTLAGMLVFRGLMIAVLGGRSIGPFDPTFQKLSSGYIPEIVSSSSGVYLTSFAVGLAAAAFLVWQNFKGRSRRVLHEV